jgi:uncharacterized protein YdeI (YjbR/CyaY-like superfamily)
MEKVEYPILFFDSQKLWRQWLEKNYATVPGVWLEFFKKGSGVTSLNYTQALEEALCFGWIDSQTKGKNEKSYLQKFTPRRSKSPWSKINREHIARLIKENRMHAAGFAEVEAAKKDGRWDVAYDSSKNMVVPDDFFKELARNKKAEAFFQTVNKSNKFAVAYQLHTAKKAETRERRIKKFIEMFERGEKIY